MKLPPALGFVAFLLACTGSAAVAMAQQRVLLRHTERPLSQLPADARAAVVSPDGQHSAWVAPTDGGLLDVVLDDRPENTGAFYDHIARGSPFFSPDGKHLAYVAHRAGGWRIVTDGKEGPAFERIWDDTAVFSPDSQRFAFVAERDKRLFVVIDGKPGPACTQVVDGSLRFSSDSARLAYTAVRDGTYRVVVDGVEGSACDAAGRPVFGADGKHFGYTAVRGNVALIVMDERDAGAVPGLRADTLALGADGARFACVAGARGAMRIVVDGQPQKAYDWIFADTITFSPDGRRVAYAAGRAGGGAVAVIDGAEGLRHDGIGAIAFAPDGRRVAYLAQDVGAGGARWSVVVDGQPGRAYDWIAGPPRFSADGRHLLYVAERWSDRRTANEGDQEAGRVQFAVIDGVEGKPYRMIRGMPTFSPDGTRVAFAATNVADDRFENAEDVAVDPLNPGAGSKVALDRSARYLTLTPKEQRKPVELLLVEERLAQD